MIWVHNIVQLYSIKSVEDNGLRVDIAAPNKKAPSMSMALDQYIKEANKRRR